MAAWRKEEVDAARHRREKREARRNWIAHGSVEFCEATTPFDLVDEPKESLHGRETDRDLRSVCRCVAWFLIYFFSERAVCVRGGGGGMLPHFFLLFSFPCSADHERDWRPCKVVFFGLATITLNARNNDTRPYNTHKEA